MSRAEKTPAPPDGPEAEGTIIRSTGSWYEVQVADRVIPSKVRGKFRLGDQDATNPVAVGDVVTIRLNADDTGFITEIHPRRSKLSRRAAGRRVGMEQIIVANLDAVWSVQAVRMPRLNPAFVDRVLVVAEANELEAGIIFNKVDLLDAEEREDVEALADLYRGLGYPVLLTSAKTGEGTDALRGALAGRTSTVTGPSGVGKSALLNAVEPGLSLRTGTVSEKTRKGRHTTTFASLFPLSFGGYIVDTPGIREFGLMGIEDWELSHFFVEFRPYLEECRFPTCTHDHEPGCAVKEAVEQEEITEVRYVSYLNILHSIRLGEQDVGR